MNISPNVEETGVQSALSKVVYIIIMSGYHILYRSFPSRFP